MTPFTCKLGAPRKQYEINAATHETCRLSAIYKLETITIYHPEVVHVIDGKTGQASFGNQSFATKSRRRSKLSEEQLYVKSSRIRYM